MPRTSHLPTRITLKKDGENTNVKSLITQFFHHAVFILVLSLGIKPVKYIPLLNLCIMQQNCLH
jgi:hypothetical protein